VTRSARRKSPTDSKGLGISRIEEFLPQWRPTSFHSDPRSADAALSRAEPNEMIVPEDLLRGEIFVVNFAILDSG
jgi:hypothetical protein